MGKPPVSLDKLTVRDLQIRVDEFNRGRGWPNQHSVRSLSEALVVECAELLELSLWGASAEEDEAALKDEVADVGIYLLSLANHLKFDLGDVILRKISSNEKRFPTA